MLKYLDFGSGPLDAKGLLARTPPLAGLAVNLVWPLYPRYSRSIWGERPRFDWVVARWSDDGDRVDPLAGAHWSFRVAEHIGIAAEPTWPTGMATPGLKHLSILCGTVERDEFRAHYRHHVELVHTHLSSMWRYVQNDIEEAHGDRAGEFAAVSELSYASIDDYERRWTNGADSERDFTAQEGFLDLPRTVTMFCTEVILR